MNGRDPAVALGEAIRRIEDPAHAGFLVLNRHGGVELHRTQTQVQDMRFRMAGRRGWTAIKWTEIPRLWKLLDKFKVAPTSQWETGVEVLQIRFRGGLWATFSSTEPGRVTYEDNTRSTFRPSTKLFNAALHDALVALASTDAPPR